MLYRPEHSKVINKIIFVGLVRDDLKQVKSDVRNMSEKLETLKSFETGDKGQFQETNS